MQFFSPLKKKVRQDDDSTARASILHSQNVHISNSLRVPELRKNCVHITARISSSSCPTFVAPSPSYPHHLSTLCFRAKRKIPTVHPNYIRVNRSAHSISMAIHGHHVLIVLSAPRVVITSVFVSLGQVVVVAGLGVALDAALLGVLAGGAVLRVDAARRGHLVVAHALVASTGGVQSVAAVTEEAHAVMRRGRVVAAVAAVAAVAVAAVAVAHRAEERIGRVGPGAAVAKAHVAVAVVVTAVVVADAAVSGGRWARRGHHHH